MRSSHRLATGVAALPVALREGCRQAVLRHQAADGGFRGRAGDADDWYTAFAVRTFALTGEADAALMQASAWLRRRTAAPATAADAACRIQAALLLNLLGQATPLRPATEILATASGTSVLFLAADAWTCLGRKAPDPTPLRDRQNADGGFAEHVGEASQTNATAAALASLGPALPAAERERAIAWLVAMQGEDGGIRAHAAAPASDLLSAFVTAWALHERLPALRLGELARFVQTCRCGGGFSSCPGDEADPEYTWYGLALLGLLAAQAGQRGTPPPRPRSCTAWLLAWPPTRRLGWRLVR